MQETVPSACALLHAALEDLHVGLEHLIKLQARLDEVLPHNDLPPKLLQEYSLWLDRLVEAETQRVKALAMLQPSPMRMDEALERCPTPAPQWEAIRERLPQVALNNRKHAQVLHKASASIQAALTLLGVLPPQVPLYGPHGRQPPPPGGRSLGSA